MGGNREEKQRNSGETQEWHNGLSAFGLCRRFAFVRANVRVIGQAREEIKPEVEHRAFTSVQCVRACAYVLICFIKIKMSNSYCERP